MATDRLSMSGRGVGLTGGGGHLGSAMALALADAGATVVIIGRTLEPLEVVVEAAAQSEGEVMPLQADAFHPDTVRAVLDLLEPRGRDLQGWVNNAYSGGMSQLDELDEPSVSADLRSGLAEPIAATARVGKYMTARGRGSIVNVASMYGMVAPHPEVYRLDEDMHSPAVYGAAKAGLIQFTRYAAVHLAASGVRVNALVPGAFPPPSVTERERFISRLEQQIPMGRVGRPEELGGAAVFLLSDASSYMTGQSLVIDGGWTAW
jgi:gluconate 5-dehydrogenase